MTFAAKPDQLTQAELIARDYAAMGYTHWRCNTCAFKHSLEWVADPDNGPHCDNCDADLFPFKTSDTGLEALRAHINARGRHYKDFCVLEVKNANGLEFVAHFGGIDVWKNNHICELTEQMALEWCAFLGLEVLK